MATLIIGLGGKPKPGDKHMNPMEAFLGGKKGKSDSEPLVEDELSSMKSGKITFSKPSGFKVPDGVKDGEVFDAMATVKFENGKLVLHELDGTPVDDEYEPESEEEYPEEESVEGESEPEEPEEGEEGEAESLGFLDAIEKKSKKSNPFKK
jgi:hypothetical protein